MDENIESRKPFFKTTAAVVIAVLVVITIVVLVLLIPRESSREITETVVIDGRVVLTEEEIVRKVEALQNISTERN